MYRNSIFCKENNAKVIFLNFAIIPLLHDLANGESALEDDVSSSWLLWITNRPFADFRAVLRAIHQSDIHEVDTTYLCTSTRQRYIHIHICISLKAIAVTTSVPCIRITGKVLLIYNYAIYFVYNRVNKYLSDSRDGPMQVKVHKDAVKRRTRRHIKFNVKCGCLGFCGLII